MKGVIAMTTTSEGRKTRKATSVETDKVDTDKSVETEKTENVENTETQNTETEKTETQDSEKTENRIPEILNVPILSGFCNQYLTVLDEVAEYNKLVTAADNAEWTPGKILAKSREFARPADNDVTPDTEILAALENWEKLVSEVAAARTALLNTTAEKLGIQLSAVVERNTETESELKEKRKVAVEIGTQLSMFAKMINDEEASKAVLSFLAANPLPSVGRNQSRSFTDAGASTPKYRVTVEVSKDDKVLFTADGFTKASLALPKLNVYPRGESPKREDFQKVWEAAGNSPEKTVKDTVEFEDHGLHFKIVKK